MFGSRLRIALRIEVQVRDYPDLLKGPGAGDQGEALEAPSSSLSDERGLSQGDGNAPPRSRLLPSPNMRGRLVGDYGARPGPTSVCGLIT